MCMCMRLPITRTHILTHLLLLNVVLNPVVQASDLAAALLAHEHVLEACDENTFYVKRTHSTLRLLAHEHVLEACRGRVLGMYETYT